MVDFDVAVVGGGPTGSTAAIHLARAGARVVLFDRAKFPRDKPCGGGVTARAYAEAPVDLKPVVEHEVNRVRFSFRLGESFDYAYPKTLVYMTQRLHLDAFLLEQARSAGVEVREGSMVREVGIEDGRALVAANGSSASALVVIGADGANGAVSRSLGLDPAPDPPVALEANFAYDADDSSVP